MDSLRERVLSRLAAVSPGTSQNELARRVSMSPSALSRALNGERGLAGDELVNLSRELEISIDWLLTGADAFPIRVAARHRFSVVDGHHLTRNQAADRALLEDIALAYQQAQDLQVPESVPVPPDPDSARELLERAFGESWPRRFADAVERTFGIDVIKLDMPDSDGYSLAMPTGRVVVIPTAAYWARQNWTIAHELGHIARDEFTPIEEGADHSSESAANDYAARLLMPKAILSAIDWPRISEPELAKFLWETGVSIDALNHRLSKLGLPKVHVTSSSAQLIRRYPPVPLNIFDDPITERFREAAARRFPTRLLAAHEATPRTMRTLEWMLGAPAAEETIELDTSTSEFDALSDIMGIGQAD